MIDGLLSGKDKTDNKDGGRPVRPAFQRNE
jgi:hypothetical protein